MNIVSCAEQNSQQITTICMRAMQPRITIIGYVLTALLNTVKNTIGNWLKVINCSACLTNFSL